MNDILRNIQKSVVDPAVGRVKTTARGYIAAVYENTRRCDVVYYDPSGGLKKIKRLPIPKTDEGVFHEQLKPGDRVELSFRGQSDSAIHIAHVYKKKQTKPTVHKGQELPWSTHLF